MCLQSFNPWALSVWHTFCSLRWEEQRKLAAVYRELSSASPPFFSGVEPLWHPHIKSLWWKTIVESQAKISGSCFLVWLYMKNIGSELKPLVLSTDFAFTCEKSAVGNQLEDLGSICASISHTPFYKFQIITEDWNKRFSVSQRQTSGSPGHSVMTKLSLIVFLAFHLFSFVISFTCFLFHVYYYFLWGERFAPLSPCEVEFS